MKFKTLQFLRRRKKERQQMERTERWVKYLITILWVCLFMALTGCENTKQSIGISTKPFTSDEKLEDSTKLNWKITWGKIRHKDED